MYLVNKTSANFRNLKKKNAAAFKNHFESKSSYVFKNSVKNPTKCAASGLRLAVKSLNTSSYPPTVTMGTMGGGNPPRTVTGRDFRVSHRKTLPSC